MKRLLLLVAIAAASACATAGFAASLDVASWHLWAGSQTLTKSSCTITGAAAETFVNQSSPTSGNDGSATLDVLADGGSQRWAFLRFDLSSCGVPSTGGADQATLRLYMSRPPGKSFTLTLTRVVSSWTTGLTWNGAQSLAFAAAATDQTASGTGAGWITFTVTGDVDDFIQGFSTNNGWYLSASGSTQNPNKDLVQFASSSATSNPPQLVISDAQ
jgi:hypothetical protein